MALYSRVTHQDKVYGTTLYLQNYNVLLIGVCASRHPWYSEKATAEKVCR